MKLQHLAVIFIIIIIPISLVLSEYLHTHIQTIQYQTQYDTKLINATYDAANAFRLNTANNRYSTNGDSKVRDIEAAISSFYNSLGTNMGSSGYSATDLQNYTPAILCTLYDGYYINTKYFDTVLDDYTYGLKPFIFYSCRYKKGQNDFVVNYTLDNTITIIGTINGNYITKTGHLINLNNIPNNIQTEHLFENLIILDDNGDIITKTNTGNKGAQEFEYVIYNNQKVYKDGDKYFYYSTDYKKDYVNSKDDLVKINELFKTGSVSAQKYYIDAISFTNWVNSNLGDITQDNAMDSNEKTIGDFATDLGTDKIFLTSNNNDPLVSSSAFNEQRMCVIKKSIESNLIAAIANYNTHSTVGYEFVMPKIGEEEWYKIENNVCFVSFLQGLPIKSKIYNNYCVVSNNTNQETVGADSLYIVARNKKTNEIEYHKPGCKDLVENSENYEIKGAYPASDFKRKSVSLTGEDSNAHKQVEDDASATAGDTAFFFPQEYTACYDCIVNVSDTYSTDDIVKGSVSITDKSGKVSTIIIPDDLKTIYMRALARARYDMYNVNGYFGVK